MIQKINSLLARSISPINAILALFLFVFGSISGVVGTMAFIGPLAFIVGPLSRYRSGNNGLRALGPSPRREGPLAAVPRPFTAARPALRTAPSTRATSPAQDQRRLENAQGPIP